MTYEQVLHRLFDTSTRTSESEYLIRCPFHDDNKPSLSLNVSKLIFRCHACNASGKTDKLIAKFIGYPINVVHYELEYYKALSEFPKYDARSHQAKLFASKEMLTYLQDKRKWSLDVMKAMWIGYDGDRVTIPVISAFGDIVNVRFYKPQARSDEHKMLNARGFGRVRIYGIDAFKETSQHTNVILTEGEPDCIAARSTTTLPCTTTTGGAGFFDSISGDLFSGLSTTIIYDCDEAGKRGVVKAAQSINGKVFIVDLEPYLESGKDITDFLQVKSGDDLKTVIAEAKEYRQEIKAPNPTVHDDPVEVSLYESSQERFYHKLVTMNVMISGKTLSPYLIPRKVRLTCPKPGFDICKRCPMTTTGETILEFDHLNPNTIDLVETFTENHIKVFKKLAQIPHKCTVVNAIIEQAQNVEEVKVIPVLDHSTSEAEYVMRQVYYMGHSLRPNSTYRITGLTLPHPRTQQVTYLVNEATALEDSISAFKLTEEIIQSLQIFSVGNDKGEEED